MIFNEFRNLYSLVDSDLDNDQLFKIIYLGSVRRANNVMKLIKAAEHLKENKHKVYAIEQVEKSISLQNFNPVKNEAIALVFGNEVYGVEQDVVNLCDGSIEIPQLGTKHSLNVSVSIGIAVWEVAKGYL